VILGDRKLKHIKPLLINILSFAIILSVAFFFLRAFRTNWTNVQSYSLTIDLRFIALSFIAILSTYLLTTYAWFLILNSLSSNAKISYSECVATINTSSFTKYIPGKVWSYALQMYWLGKKGFSKSLIVYVNMVTVFITLSIALMLGFGFLIVSPTVLSQSVSTGLLAILIMFDIAFIKYNSNLVNRLIAVINNTLKREIKYFNTSKKTLINVHVINIVAAFCYGMGAYLVCLGIGFEIAPKNMFTVMSSMLISDVVGFLAIIVPGGLGVREGVMYLMLHGASSGPLALVLPIATRIVNMLVDISLGTIGFVLLKRMKLDSN
jgi:glycosyltransferase 2 family protein